MYREHEMKSKKCPHNNFSNCVGKECVAWTSLRDKDWTEVVFVTRVFEMHDGKSSYVIHGQDVEKEKSITDQHVRVQTYGSKNANFNIKDIDIVINETWAIPVDFEDGMEIGTCAFMRGN